MTTTYSANKLYRYNAESESFDELPSYYSDEVYALAERPYRIEVFPDSLSDGSIVWVAKYPELNGVMAQGRSDLEAIMSLKSALLDWLDFALERGLDVPMPKIDEDK